MAAPVVPTCGCSPRASSPGRCGLFLSQRSAEVGEFLVLPALQVGTGSRTSLLHGLFGDLEDQSRYIAMANLAKLSFNALFWNEEQGCLYDVIDDGQRDASIRPNQIFAVSLRHSMVEPERAKKIVDKVEAELLTPVGLRSLSPDDPHYVPVYIGSPFAMRTE